MPFPFAMVSRWLRGRDSACVASGVSVVPIGVSACAPGLAFPLDIQVGNAAEVVFVAWDPHPREPVEGVLQATSMLELAADLADSRAEGKMSFLFSEFMLLWPVRDW
ncbi:hypothetical protein Taro_051723 [Colocasia esculenta]|uniref:Uncharacterized protein n=1 Tax=Colocasia esculenta TaxID=4460 RepID=A0A843XGN4_COLES|nr:hypothetical protein [Colocasia esculenta]